MQVKNYVWRGGGVPGGGFGHQGHADWYTLMNPISNQAPGNPPEPSAYVTPYTGNLKIPPIKYRMQNTTRFEKGPPGSKVGRGLITGKSTSVGTQTMGRGSLRNDQIPVQTAVGVESADEKRLAELMALPAADQLSPEWRRRYNNLMNGTDSGEREIGTQTTNINTTEDNYTTNDFVPDQIEAVTQTEPVYAEMTFGDSLGAGEAMPYWLYNAAYASPPGSQRISTNTFTDGYGSVSQFSNKPSTLTGSIVSEAPPAADIPPPVNDVGPDDDIVMTFNSDLGTPSGVSVVTNNRRGRAERQKDRAQAKSDSSGRTISPNRRGANITEEERQAGRERRERRRQLKKNLANVLPSPTITNTVIPPSPASLAKKKIIKGPKKLPPSPALTAKLLAQRMSYQPAELRRAGVTKKSKD